MVQIEAHFGRLDVLVNSAGIVALHPAEELPETAWDATLAVNLKGVFLTCQAVGRRFISQHGGSIINLASQAGVVALPNHLAYCASKAGVIGLTQVLALEWGPGGVRVNAIQPGLIRSAMTEAMPQRIWDQKLAEIPMGRAAEPSEVASVVTFLASDMSSYMTGCVLEITGGRHI